MKKEFEIIEYREEKYIVVYNHYHNSKGVCIGCAFDFKNKCIITPQEKEVFGKCYIPSISGNTCGANAVFMKSN